MTQHVRVNRSRLQNNDPAITVSGDGQKARYARRVDFMVGGVPVAHVIQFVNSVYMQPADDTTLVLHDVDE